MQTPPNKGMEWRTSSPEKGYQIWVAAKHFQIWIDNEAPPHISKSLVTGQKMYSMSDGIYVSLFKPNGE